MRASDRRFLCLGSYPQTESVPFAGSGFRACVFEFRIQGFGCRVLGYIGGSLITYRAPADNTKGTAVEHMGSGSGRTVMTLVLLMMIRRVAMAAWMNMKQDTVPNAHLRDCHASLKQWRPEQRLEDAADDGDEEEDRAKCYLRG